VLEFLSPGLLTSVQDLGRAGFRHLGISASGAADRDALRVANKLVGNDERAAGIEFTLTGPTIRFARPRLVALTGGEVEATCDGIRVPMWRPVALAAGSELRLGRIARGARGYLAVGGGIDVPQVLGSRGTDLRAAFGGHKGRALAADDRLKVGRPRDDLGRALWAALERRGGRFAAASWWVAPTEDLRGDMAFLHLLPGHDIAMLDPRVLRVLRDGIWTVGADSDRMGLRFDGPGVPQVPHGDRVSTAVVPGTVQLPPDGRPIVLGVDAQTVGGYHCVANVIRADLGRAMQLKPGERVRAVLVSTEAARAIRESRERDLARMFLAIDQRLAQH
jgi:antagonist of KipI